MRTRSTRPSTPRFLQRLHVREMRVRSRHTFVALTLLTATFAFSAQASDIDSARNLANYCRSLAKGTKGTGRHIRIPNTKQALLCWGYMQAVQQFSVLVEEDGHRLIGSCPPEQVTLLQLIHSFLAYARSHPGALEGNTAAAVIEWLQATFPCR
jgi:Ssp1 endopeptidase immunity protein Rap1a